MVTHARDGVLGTVLSQEVISRERMGWYKLQLFLSCPKMKSA